MVAPPSDGDPSSPRSDDANDAVCNGEATEASPASGGAGLQAATVKVAVRVRPMIGLETTTGCQPCLTVDEEHNQVVTGDDRLYAYDFAFGSESTQEEVYAKTTRPLVQKCTEGYNCCIFAYGQTGSGKTHTMGNAYHAGGGDAERGIISRAVTDIFARLKEMEAAGSKATVSASFLEVHNEDILDLLAPEALSGAARESLQLRENLQGEVVVANLSQHPIADAQELGALLERGALQRATASTAMNHHSSRSHAICTLQLEVTRPGADAVLTSRFHLVDLAGSERAKRTGTEGQRLREGININKGLFSLGKVICALAERAGGNAAAHVPYRDAKLTRLLQDSLGGNSHTLMIACVSPADSNMDTFGGSSHTLMIACVSPADSNMDESLSTLKYAQRAMRIENAAVRNAAPSSGPVSYAEVIALRKEVRALQLQLVRAQLGGGGGGGGGSGAICASAVAEELHTLRRGLAAAEARAAAATDAARAAAERELTAALRAERWRQRCSELCAVLGAGVPPHEGGEGGEKGGVAVGPRAALPDWANELKDGEEEGGEGGTGGALAREQHARIVELEAELAELKIALQLTRDEHIASDGIGGSGGGGDGGLDDSFASDGGSSAGGEELQRVDAEIQAKELELHAKSAQALIYENMKAQFEGVLTRLQTEKEDLQTQRDTLLAKLSKEGGRGAGQGGGGGGSGEHAQVEKMRALVKDLESRLKDTKARLAQHQRTMRERAEACREAERLRAEVEEAKRRRAGLQKQMADDAAAHRRERHEAAVAAARGRRQGERLQWEVRKLQEAHAKTQASLRRKMEEHAAAIRKLRALTSNGRAPSAMDKSTSSSGGGASAAARSTGGGGSSMQVARRQELESWCAHLVEEAAALQRARRALGAQLELRAEAAAKLHAVDNGAGRSTAGGSGGGGGGGDAAAVAAEAAARLRTEVEERSAVIKSLQEYVVAGQREEGGEGGGKASSRWARLRSSWEMKVVMTHLLSRAVCARVTGLEAAEGAAMRDHEAAQARSEVARLSRELRAAKAAAVTAQLQGAFASFPALGGGGGAAANAQLLLSLPKADGGDGDDAQKGGGESADEGEGDLEESLMILGGDDDDEVEDEEDEEFDIEEDDDEEWSPDGSFVRPTRRGKRAAAAAAAAAPTAAAADTATAAAEATAAAAPAAKRARGRSSGGSDVSVGDVGEPLEAHNVQQLKALLRVKGLPVSGNKPVLIARLREAAAAAAAAADADPRGTAAEGDVAAAAAQQPSGSGGALQGAAAASVDGGGVGGGTGAVGANLGPPARVAVLNRGGDATQHAARGAPADVTARPAAAAAAAHAKAAPERDGAVRRFSSMRVGDHHSYKHGGGGGGSSSGNNASAAAAATTGHAAASGASASQPPFWLQPRLPKRPLTETSRTAAAASKGGGDAKTASAAAAAAAQGGPKGLSASNGGAQRVPAAATAGGDVPSKKRRIGDAPALPSYLKPTKSFNAALSSRSAAAHHPERDADKENVSAGGGGGGARPWERV
ncbi:hypothetical protein JKP88DRAFT_348881 [Tribonema minus]|uniref:Kinesin motor domain-containing protein n=1 Tax=Tribonema minus TaxID=303371 RepID=A0A835YYL2_9STRA|nr:hypothetical protein JKP88DRAFT_348881 [Tribonema minus]